MRLLTFLRSVLPALREGEVYARFTTTNEVAPQGENYPSNRGFNSIESLVSATEDADKKGRGVWYGLASFGPAVNDKGNLLRTHNNVKRLQVFVVDIDCGEGKPYADWQEASVFAAELERLMTCNASLWVCSGYGLHLYWCLDAPVEAAEWQPVADRFKRALLASKVVEVDPTITADSARVMRPVRTTNKKRGKAAQVWVIGGSKERYALWEIEDAISMLENIPGVELPFELPAGKPARRAINSDLDYKPDFPKVSAHAVAKNCAQIAMFRDTGSAGNYPHWFAAVGTVKHSLEGEAIAHEWSAVDVDYSEAGTQLKLDSSYQQGPAKCDTFQACNPSGCEGCRFAGRITTPLQAATMEPTPVPAPAEGDEPELCAAPGDDKPLRVGADGAIYVRSTSGEWLPVWRHEFYTGHGEHLVKYTNDFEQHGLFMATEGEKGPFSVRINDNLLYPLDMFDGETGAELRVATKCKTDRSFRVFNVPLALVNDGGSELRKLFGAKRIIISSGSQKTMSNMMTCAAQLLQGEKAVATFIEQFGWQTKDGNASAVMEAGFAYGDHLYRNIGGKLVVQETTQSVKLRGLDSVARIAGDIGAWKKAVAQYNDRRWAALQTPILFALAAPIMRLMPALHGFLINYMSPESGVGKTSAVQVALAIYGNPNTMTMRGGNANQGGVTPHAIYHRLVHQGAVPALVDEIGNMKASALSPLIHALANGKERERGVPDGSVIGGREWWMPTFTTSNESLLEKLTEVKASAAAEHARAIEVRVPVVLQRADLEGRRAVEAVASNYGHAGYIWIPHVVEHAHEILAEVEREEATLGERYELHNAERFYQKMLSAYLVAFRHAKALGLVPFAEDVVEAYVGEMLEHMRHETSLNVRSALSVLVDCVQHYSTSALILDRRPARTGTGFYERPEVLKDPSGNEPSMTLMHNSNKGGTGKREVFIRETAVRKYLGQYNVSFNALVTEVTKVLGCLESELRDSATALPFKLRRVEMAPGTRYQTGGVKIIYFQLDAIEFARAVRGLDVDFGAVGSVEPIRGAEADRASA